MNKTTNKVAKSDLNIQKAIVSMDVAVTNNDIYKHCAYLQERGTQVWNNLYDVMEEVYNLYSLLKVREEEKLLKIPTILKNLNKKNKDWGMEYSTKIQHALIRYVFGKAVNRKNCSKYAIAIEKAFELNRVEIENAGGYAEWVKETGGFTKLLPTNSKPKVVQQLENDIKVRKELDAQTPIVEEMKFDITGVEQNQYALLLVYKHENTFSVMGVDTNADRTIQSAKAIIEENNRRNTIEIEDNVIRVGKKTFSTSSKVGQLLKQLNENERKELIAV